MMMRQRLGINSDKSISLSSYLVYIKKMVTIISSTEDFKYIIGQRTPVVASFWVDGSEVCDAINGLAKAYHAVHFVKVKANEVPVSPNVFCCGVRTI
jgi:hypothetical protein